MRMAMALGTPGLSPALWGQGLVSIGHPSQLCFAHKQVVGIIVDSSALRDGPPLAYLLTYLLMFRIDLLT